MRTKGEDVTDAALRLERIKARINQSEYRVDADAVADAIVSRLLVTLPETGGTNPPASAPGQPA
jgi:hypothetical protein